VKAQLTGILHPRRPRFKSGCGAFEGKEQNDRRKIKTNKIRKGEKE
jgi:hypothetical protein